MLKLKTIAALLISMFIPFLLTAGEGQIRRSPHAVKGEYIVVLNDDTPRDSVPGIVHQLVNQHGGSVQRIWQDALKGYFVLMNEGQANGLSHNPKVKYVEENAEMFLSSEVPTKVDPACDPPSACPTSDNRLWHLDRIDQNGAAPSGSYAYCNDGTGVYVYVVDLGVQRAHHEFNNDPNRVLDGYNAGDDGAYYPAYDPCHGRLAPVDHGTGAGSLVAGRNVGVAPGAKIVPVKVANCGDTSPRTLDRSQSYASGEIVFFNSTSYICVTAGTTGPTTPPTPYPWVGDPGCANGAGLHDGSACFDYRGQHTAQTVQMVIEGVDWILRPSNPNPTAHQVATFSTYRMGSGPQADAATQFTIAGRPISFEEAVRNLINAGVTVIASANNQNANACDTSPARLSRNSPYRPAPSDPAWGSYKVITAGGTMITNNPDGPSAADGGSIVHTAEPTVDLTRPVNNARWVCGPGDSDNCSAAPPASGDPNNANYTGLTLGSNGGQCVTLFAPAKNIPVASFTGYRDTRASGGTASGTSWSAPIVAGVVARILGNHPTYTVDDVYNELMANYVSGDLQDTSAYPLNPAGVTGTPNVLLHIPDVSIGPLPSTINGPVTAIATGTAPLSYQWYQVGSTFDASTYSSNAPNPTLLAGATSATLSVSPSVVTSYFLRVKSNCGSADSNITTYNPCQGVAITSQPVSSPSTITYGGSATLSIGVTGAAPVTVQWFTSASVYVGSGTSISVNPGVTTTYYVTVSNACPSSLTSATLTLTVQKAVPVITWTLAGLTYPTALGASQLNASSNVAGSFVYTPAAGTILDPGTQTLSVSFTPTDTTHYTGATSTATINVSKATQTILWNTPGFITSGAYLTTAQLNATVTVPGSAPAGALTYNPTYFYVPSPGNQTLTVTAAATAYYNTATASVVLFVCSPPTITTQPTGSSIPAGNYAPLSVSYAPRTQQEIDAGGPVVVNWYKTTGTSTWVGTGASISVRPYSTTSYYAIVGTNPNGGCGSTQSNTVTVTLTTYDAPPVASFTVTCTGNTCNFNASASSDDHGITSYEWYWGDGSANSIGGPTISHTYPTSANYTIQLVVTDTIGQTGTTVKGRPCSGRGCVNGGNP